MASDERKIGRLAGIDYGTVRIGIAVTDREQRLASPLENYNRRTPDLDAAYFRRLLAEEQICRLIVGLPLHLNGKESQKSLEARQFGVWLQELTGLPVEFYDERFTSSEAQQYLAEARLSHKKRKARLDKLAAQIMLTSYLESSQSGEYVPRGLD